MENIFLPALYCPFPLRIYKYAEAIQEQSIEWALGFNLVKGEAAKKRLCALNFGVLAAHSYPNAAFEELKIASDWNVWLFVLDDQCQETSIAKHPEQRMVNFDRLVGILKNPDTAADQSEPLENSLRDILQRIREKVTTTCMTRFLRSVEECLYADIWRARNWAEGIVPSLANYIKIRSLEGAVYTVVELFDMTERINLPLEVREHDVVKRLTRMAGNVICWANDIFSLDNDLKGGKVHNFVLVLQHEYQLTLQEAVYLAVELHNSEIRAFLDLEQHLPSFGTAVETDLKLYVSGLHSWIHGNLDWAQMSRCYYLAQTVAVGEKANYVERLLTT
jgi:5-epi-alpha-selinene synthase